MRGLALVLGVVLLAPAAAFADDAFTLESARRSYEELRYDEASALLEAALEAGELDAAQRREALRLAGIVEVIRGQDARARARFRELLEGAPDATLPSGLSPKITGVFEEVREQVEAERAREAALEARPGPEEPGAPDDIPAASRMDPSSGVTASPVAPLPEGEADDDGLSAVALGVAAGAAVAAAVVVTGAGALFFLARGQPPESSLGTMQLP